MTDFTALSPLPQGLLGLLALLGVFMFTYNLLRWIQLGRLRQLLPTVLLLGLSFWHTQVMIMNAAIYPHYPAGIHLKAVPAALACLAFIAAAAAQQVHLCRWSRSHVTAASVKEAFDRLPAALCYYLPGGLIKLVNASMNALCQEAVGAPLMDPESFWRDVRRGTSPPLCRAGRPPCSASGTGGSTGSATGCWIRSWDASTSFWPWT